MAEQEEFSVGSSVDRTPRAKKTREKKAMRKPWAPPSMLDSPPAPDGFRHRWIRAETRGFDDTKNVSAKMREGWEPVKAEEQPKFSLLVDPNSRFKDNIEIGGLLLCKTPEEFVSQRNDYYANQTQAQTIAIDNSFMRENDARMPLFNERKSSTSFGKGT